MVEHTSKEFGHALQTLRQRLSTMAERAAAQIAMAMKALIEQDDDLARQVVRGDATIDAEEAAAVIKADAEIDRLNASLFAQLVAHVAADPATVTRVLPLTSVCRHLERIGDHVKNLAEEVIFMVAATDVRHRLAT